MILTILKLPLLILYCLSCAILLKMKDAKQRKTLMVCAILIGGVLAI